MKCAVHGIDRRNCACAMRDAVFAAAREIDTALAVVEVARPLSVRVPDLRAAIAEHDAAVAARKALP